MGESNTKMVVGAEPYDSLPKGHIRLLQIHPKNDGKPRCSYNLFPLNHPPGYLAVSYTWGPPEEGFGFTTGTSTITLNGQPIQVKQNLFDMLERLEIGYAYKDAWLWIDALCINQGDEMEKTVQVNQMGRIYQEARLVVVWLGHYFENAPRVLSIVEQLSKVYAGNLPDGPDRSEFDRYTGPLAERELLRRVGLESANLNDWMDFVRFMRRSWFSRTWTLQEVALAQKITCLCGQYEIDWSSIQGAAWMISGTTLGDDLRVLWQLRGSGPPEPALLCSLNMAMRDLALGNTKEHDSDKYKVWYNSPDAQSTAPALLDQCLANTSMTKCKDPRDKVFAILGIVEKAVAYTKSQPLRLTADYEKSVVEVYTETMAHILSAIGTLTPLARVHHPLRSEVVGLPSWVVDFSVGQNTLLDKLNESSFEEAPESPVYVDASKQCHAGFDIYRTTLSLHLHKHATVTHIGESWEEIMSYYSFELTTQLAIARSELCPAKGPRFHDLWRTALCRKPSLDDGNNGELFFGMLFCALLIAHSSYFMAQSRAEGQSDLLPFANWFYQMASLDETGTLNRAIAEDAPEPHPDTEHASRMFESLAVRTWHRRRLFLLDNGEIGLGSHDVRPGDVLCIIADGGRTPFVVRKVSLCLNAYRLIGEAYVRGIMYGEAVDQMKREGGTWEKAWFC